MRVRATTRLLLLATGIGLVGALPATAQETPAAPPEPEQQQEQEEEEPPAAAEEEEPTPDRLRVVVELSAWIAQGAGASLYTATELDPTNAVNTKLLGPDTSTETAPYFEVGFSFPRNVGTLVGTYYSNSQDDLTLDGSDPGRFVFGEILVHPMFAGYNNDGLADAFRSSAGTKLTDLRIDFYRTAFESARIRGRWFVGLRSVDYRRTVNASYYALVPDLPPVLPPIPGAPFAQLVPLSDIATSDSSFEGRGIEGGLEVEVPLYRDRLLLEAGFSLGVLRGQIDAAYRSQTNYWLLGSTGAILAPPYSEFDDLIVLPNGETKAVAADIQQAQLVLGIQPSNISTSNDVLETSLGVRYRILERLEAFLGFRSVRYSDVAAEVRPVVSTVLAGTNLQTVTETKHSVTYEGFYLGVGTRF